VDGDEEEEDGWEAILEELLEVVVVLPDFLTRLAVFIGFLPLREASGARFLPMVMMMMVMRLLLWLCLWAKA
jgi:branched-subunit amino acid transport protein AzlD